jgi:MSHA biogenesis protein MshP
MRAGPHTARGFSLVVAIFVILVLAALGAFAIKIGLSQDQTATLDLLVARAQAAADSGIEYGANRVLKGGAGCAPTGTTYTPLTLATPGLSGFKITVTCTSTPHGLLSASNPIPKTYNVYALISVAQRGTYGTPDFVSRTARRSVNDSPLP